MASLFSNPRVQQVIEQYACKMPTKTSLTPKERRNIEGILREKSEDFFQLYQDENNSKYLLEVLRQYEVGSTVVTMSSFILASDSVSFMRPKRVMGTDITGFDFIDGKKVSGWMMDIQKVLPAFRCQRAGKIFELALGPFMADQKETVFKNVFHFSLADVGDLQLSKTNHRTEKGATYNIKTIVGLHQNNLNEPFIVNVRVDINNRKLQKTMEPNQMIAIWNYADSMVEDHLETLINLE